jgi:hypothetical protein
MGVIAAKTNKKNCINIGFVKSEMPTREARCGKTRRETRVQFVEPTTNHFGDDEHGVGSYFVGLRHRMFHFFFL